ncbi:MAG: DUF1501 domain-containing protein [Planctomycetia bacterium]|nr:DUF1501 domain-containing protein [Planctomycetia bacterium]
MLSIEHRGQKLCDGLTRRQWLSVGTLSAVGLSLPAMFRSRALAEERSPATRGAERPRPRGFGKAKACIQVFLWGGPGAQETWDLKPKAPEGTRGDFKPIATAVPGFSICEHLPQLAKRADRYTIVRSLSHTGVNHGTSAYHMLTGHIHFSPGTLRHPSKRDMPNLGVSAARFLSRPAHLPGHVALPSIVNDGDGLPVPGQGAGFLGSAYEPFLVLGDPTQKDFRVPALALADNVSRERLERRVSLQAAIEQQAAHLREDPAGVAVDSAFERALDLLQSSKTEAAFDLSREPEKIRDRYGWHHFAQSLLLARRLIEAGVPLVTVYWNSPSNADNQSWDTHTNQHERMRGHLLPPFDQAMSALLDELIERGMIDTTLVTWYGEFGRTPKINKAGGRDHWGFCQSIGLAGGGAASGLCYGASTKDGGYPDRDAVSPDDLSATVFHLLGVDHRQETHDLERRPVPLSYGDVVEAVLA